MTGFWLVVINVKNQPDFPDLYLAGKLLNHHFIKPLLWEF